MGNRNTYDSGESAVKTLSFSLDRRGQNSAPIYKTLLLVVIGLDRSENVSELLSGHRETCRGESIDHLVEGQETLS